MAQLPPLEKHEAARGSAQAIRGNLIGSVLKCCAATIGTENKNSLLGSGVRRQKSSRKKKDQAKPNVTHRNTTACVC
jgi:hypothetical protein